MFHRTSEDKIDADEPFRGVLNEGELRFRSMATLCRSPS
jgi:hypothetical protein